MLKKSFLLFLIGNLCHFFAVAQTSQPDSSTVNKLDEAGKKHGMWVNAIPAQKGEKTYSEFGNYEHGKKYGVWYKITKEGELISIENFKNNLLDGEAKYYDYGKLYCEGTYLSKYSLQDKDTIVITDPETYLESFKELPAYFGSFRQGSWKYYDPEDGRLLREEEYAEDELIYKRCFPNFITDSVAFKKREMNLPHNLHHQTHIPEKKKTSYLKY